MQEIIENQFKVLATYKYFNKKHAVELNTGNINDFYHKLVKYENMLSDKQTEAIDNKLMKKYDMNNDIEWDNLEQELDRLYKIMKKKRIKDLPSKILGKNT